MSWLASQQHCNERSLYFKLQAMQDTHSRFYVLSSLKEQYSWKSMLKQDKKRRKEEKKAKMKRLISTILH